jgi:DNA-binding CsgD family transcriptional regulator
LVGRFQDAQSRVGAASVLTTDFVESLACFSADWRETYPVADNSADFGISVRETEVLDALSEHLTNIEIAQRLFVSVRTVESHVSSLLRKVGVTNRRELVQRAPHLRPNGQRADFHSALDQAADGPARRALCQQAIRWAVDAGDLAMQSLAFEEAAIQFRHALHIAKLIDPSDDLLRCTVAVRLGEALASATDPAAHEVLEHAAPYAQNSGNVDLIMRIERALLPYRSTPCKQPAPPTVTTLAPPVPTVR